MKKIVVDASVVIKWVIREDDSSQAADLLKYWIKHEVVMMAPLLLAPETTNILYRNANSGKIPLDEAKRGLEAVIFPSITFDLSHILEARFFIRVIEFAGQFKLPATYDAHYLALAEREGCEFWTADARLYHAVREQLAWVRLMADDPAASTPV